MTVLLCGFLVAFGLAAIPVYVHVNQPSYGRHVKTSTPAQGRGLAMADRIIFDNVRDDDFCDAEFIDGSYTYCGCSDCNDREQRDREDYYERTGER